MKGPKKYGLLATIMIAATNIITTLPKTTATCFLSRKIEYNDFLDRNFDGSLNHTNPLAHIYLSTLSNNETYTLKAMLQQPDKEQFIRRCTMKSHQYFTKASGKPCQKQRY